MHEDIITVAGLQYRKASWFLRVVAQMIDVALVFGLCVITARSLALSLIMLLVAVIYLLVGSGLLRGATLGKRLVGIKVMEARHGGPCSVIQDFLRHRYLLFANPVFLLFMAYDSAQGSLDQPETYVVHADPVTIPEVEVVPAKPAKLDLAGMRDAIQKIRDTRDDADQHGL